MSARLIEIRIHGRGGQGNVLAAYLLATAAIDEGQWAQAFPAFGAERRGAPVASFVRVSPGPHLRRSQISHPNFLIIQDQTLFHVPGILKGLQPGGGVIINSNASSDTFERPEQSRLFTLPATQQAQKYLGKPVPNTALLAAFLQLTGILPIESLVKALGHYLDQEQLDKNRTLIHAVCDMVPELQWRDTYARSA